MSDEMQGERPLDTWSIGLSRCPANAKKPPGFLGAAMSIRVCQCAASVVGSASKRIGLSRVFTASGAILP